MDNIAAKKKALGVFYVKLLFKLLVRCTILNLTSGICVLKYW